MPRQKLPPALRRSKHALTTLTHNEGAALAALANAQDVSQSDVLRSALLASPEFKTMLRKIRRAAKQEAAA